MWVVASEVLLSAVQTADANGIGETAELMARVAKLENSFVALSFTAQQPQEKIMSLIESRAESYKGFASLDDLACLASLFPRGSEMCGRFDGGEVYFDDQSRLGSLHFEGGWCGVSA